MTLTEKRQQRASHVEAMRKILDGAEQAKRALTAEEQQEYDRLDKEQERLGAEIKREERQGELDREMAASRDSGVRPQPGDGAAAQTQISDRVRKLIAGVGPEHRARLTALGHPTYLEAFRGWLTDGVLNAAAMPVEVRNTLQADLFAKGGALRPPLEFVAELIQAVDDEVFIRQWATKRTVVQAEGLGVPTLDTDPADADWTSELAVGSQATMAFGRRELRPHPLAKWMKVSNKLLRAVTSVESLVTERLRYKFAISMEKAYLTGSGSQQPLGVFTASADGVTTARDVSTDNTTTAITADGLINAKHSIKAAYWPRLRWLFHRDAVKMIRKLKDGNGQYLWQPGLTGGIPDRILETPYAASEYVPNTFTTGLYVGIIGDFSRYWIVDALDMTLQRLVELYAATNETGFVGRMESDGAPVLAEAFARVKLA